MAGVEIAILGLGLKALYEITILSHTLNSVPSSLRRSVQLVKLCYTDLEALIELRNQSIPILKTDPGWLRRVDSVIEEAQDGLVDVCKMVERVGPGSGKGLMRTRFEWLVKESTEFQAWEGVIDALHRRVLSEMTALRAAGLIRRLGWGELGRSTNSNMPTQERLEGGTVTVREWDDVGLLEERFDASILQRGGSAAAGAGRYVLPALPSPPPSHDFSDFRPGFCVRDTPSTEAGRTAFPSEISTGLAMISDGLQTTDITPSLVTPQDQGSAQTNAFLRRVGDIGEASSSMISLNSEPSSRLSDLRNLKHMSEVSLITTTSEGMEVIPQPSGTYATMSEVSLPVSGFVSEASIGIPRRPREVRIEDASLQLSRSTSSPGMTSLSESDGMDLLFGKVNFYTPSDAVELPSQPYHPTGRAVLPTQHDISRGVHKTMAQLGNDIDPAGTKRPPDNVVRPTPLRQIDNSSRSVNRVSWSMPHTSLRTVGDVYELPDGEAFRITGTINNTEAK